MRHRMRAPHGVKSFNHEGTHHEVDEHGMVHLDSAEAVEAAMSHGFTEPHVASHDESIPMRRGDIVEMLRHLGIEIAGGAVGLDKLVDMLKAAVQAKAAEVAKTVEADLFGKDGDKPAVDADKVDHDKPSDTERAEDRRGHKDRGHR